jgi:hypothetical protein
LPRIDSIVGNRDVRRSSRAGPAGIGLEYNSVSKERVEGLAGGEYWRWRLANVKRDCWPTDVGDRFGFDAGANGGGSWPPESVTVLTIVEGTTIVRDPTWGGEAFEGVAWRFRWWP